MKEDVGMSKPAVYIGNRSPTKAVEGKPYEALLGDKPKVGNFRVFGCSAYSHIPKDERHKCIFLGFSTNHKGYCLYDPSCRRIIHSRDVRFKEFVSGIEKEFLPVKPKESQVIFDTSADTKIVEDDKSESSVCTIIALCYISENENSSNGCKNGLFKWRIN